MKLIIRKRKGRNKKGKTPNEKSDQQSKSSSSILEKTLSKLVEENIASVQTSLGNSSDLVIREFKFGTEKSVNAVIFYLDGLVDRDYVHHFITEALMVDIRITKQSDHTLGQDLYTVLKERCLPNTDISEITVFKELYSHLLSGDTILLLDGNEKGISISSRGGENRGVQEPSSQTVVRGPKDGFSETLRTNTSLIRRRIKDPNLWIEQTKAGKKTQTDIAICYIKGIANDDIVKEVKERINRIEMDGILESGYIEELIQDETYTPFPTIYNTERPDAICAGLLEGRVAIIVDGTPFVLLVPALFVHFFQATEDYYQRSDIGSVMRMLRFFCFFLALLTPSVYIALTTFHQEMIPTQLLISLAAQREGVPFPAYVEALMMEVTFEILREAGTRMPRAVGSAISIVGALVLGQAAVEAGIVSSAMVIVVSLTAISSFVSPTFNMAISIRLLRFGFMTFAAMFGLIGIILGLIILVLHLSSLRSFGIPYLAPMGPFIKKDQKDTLIRFPFWKMRTRPRLISQKDIVREDTPSPKPASHNENN